MKLLYLAGPYRARTWLGILVNIYRAWRASIAVWRRGWTAVCPHTNTFWMSEWPIRLPAALFLRGDLKLLSRCDGILMLPRWQTSLGARAEMFFAYRCHIPIYYSLDELPPDAPKGR